MNLLPCFWHQPVPRGWKPIKSLADPTQDLTRPGRLIFSFLNQNVHIMLDALRDNIHT